MVDHRRDTKDEKTHAKRAGKSLKGLKDGRTYEENARAYQSVWRTTHVLSTLTRVRGRFNYSYVV